MKFIYDGHSNKSGVYKIINTKNGRIYIGSAKRFKERASEHLRLLRKGTSHNKFLQADFNKCGKEAFDFCVVEVVEGNRKARLLIEKKYLDKYYDGQKMCYNFLKKPTSSAGCHPKDTKERRKKRSEAFKNTWKRKREQIVQKQKEHWSDPTVRHRMSQTQKQRIKQDKLVYEQCMKNLEKARKRREKHFHLVSPSGEEHKGKNIMSFCMKHGLDFRQISDLVKGKHRVANGWKTFTNRKPKYELKSPTGKLFGFDFIKKFSRQQNLSHHQLYKLFSGKITTHREWTRT